MSETMLNLDVKNVEDFTTLEADTEAKVRCISVEVRANKRNDGQHIAFRFEVMSDDNADDIYHRVSMPSASDDDKTKRRKSIRIREAIEALGVEFSTNMDLADLEGRECWVIVGLEEDDSGQKRNNIRKFVGGR